MSHLTSKYLTDTVVTLVMFNLANREDWYKGPKPKTAIPYDDAESATQIAGHFWMIGGAPKLWPHKNG